MSVPESKRGEGKFTVLIEARNLTAYTLQICANEKIFVKKYENSLMDDIVSTAKNIFTFGFSANEVRVTDSFQAEKRLHLILDAINECDKLLALIQLSKPVYHLKSQRIKYWGLKTVTVRELMKKWYQSECKRYKDLLA